MVERKTNHHLSKVREREIAGNGEGVAPRKSVEPFDHWAFLDEIEAPMWVDLNVEVRSSYEDNYDDWFETCHLFHQCSSRQLIYMLSRAGEGNANMDFGIQPPSSPKLPPSVSRSRGKKYRTREWGHSNLDVSSNKPHPVKNLSSKSSWVNIGSGQKMKTKPCNGYRKGIAPSKTNSVCEISLPETSGPNYPKPSSILGDSKTSSSSAAIQEANNKSASTITFESSEHKQHLRAVKEIENKSESTITSEICGHQHQKPSEVTSQIVTHTSGLLSALRVTLRKSCVTRQAYRVEIVGGRQSSGKSSVGSSSHPGYDANRTFPASQNKDTTPDSRNFERAPQATKDKVKVSNVLKESAVKTRDLTAKSKWGSKTISTAKSTHQENVKPKAAHSKAMRLHRVNGQDSVTAAAKADVKVRVNKHNRLGDGKENATSQRFNNRAVGTVQKATKQIAPQKSDRTGLVVPKGKISGRSEGKSLTNVTQKVYFR
ncbi:Hyphal wall protein [Actinidia chinensis var. chinensis]|uniref:Hyphal wall protein n=1 Tax=Actinidia chinensis var. chinensis TaxID=1590841 RepID=A0A2R6PRF4_ACTCC|nr:Hyphal wall protein [Actinidia chinensis var. chinensis]